MLKKACQMITPPILLLLGLLQPGVATAQTAWLYDFEATNWHSGRPWTMGIHDRLTSPDQAVFGTKPRPGLLGEIAMTTAIIRVGDLVPLPMYSDGSQADEGEIFWTAQLWRASFPIANGLVAYRWGDYASATFSGRQLVDAVAQINGGGPSSPPTSAVEVLVNVVAVRPHDRRKQNR